MASVSVELLRELSAWAEPPCFSIYLPIDLAPPNGAEATRVALKSMIRATRDELRATGTLSRTAVDEMLAPVQELLTARRWPAGCRGIGLFGAPGCSIHADADVPLPALSVVADRFVVTPLVAGIHGDDRFYVLAISQNCVRFLRGDRHRLTEVAVPGLPASRDDALWYEERERQLTVHGGARPGAGWIRGHGAPPLGELHKEQLPRFFQAVDHAVSRHLHAEHAPLLVAGVGAELATYREANHYPHLAELVDVGNPERLSTGELHDRLWPIALRTLDAPRREVVARVHESQLTLTSVSAILTAAEEGRVASLLVQPGQLVWGRLDGTDGHPERGPGDVELVSVAIGRALDQGATIFPASAEEMPGGAPVAALLRY